MAAIIAGQYNVAMPTCAALRLKEIYHASKSRGVRKVISGFIKHYILIQIY